MLLPFLDNSILRIAKQVEEMCTSRDVDKKANLFHFPDIGLNVIYCITLYFRGRKFSRKVNLKYFREKIFSRIDVYTFHAKISSRENIFPRK